MNILSIAGSDPSAGAGIQNDIKTFSALGTHGLTVITSITSQNTTKFTKIEPVSAKMIKSQLDSVFSDFEISAIKIGMVYNSSIIKAIHSKLNKTKIPIILDPVIKSTTGGKLIENSALTNYKKLLVPLSYAITPNVFEAEKISGVSIKNKQDLLNCAQKIIAIGAKNVVITGNSFETGKISDFVLDSKKHYIVSGKKLSHVNHGSGCNYSASLTVAIAKGKNIHNAAKFAKSFTYNAIKNSQKIGKGVLITKARPKIDQNSKLLSKAIEEFKELKSFNLIPECQTNFVYSKTNPKSIKNVLGVVGRIVKVGKSVVVAGELEYGGSRHVASAVVEITKKFPQLRSAINIKYDKKFIQKFRKKRFFVLSYDRAHEPIKIKMKENMSISWGIKNAIKNTSRPPDVVYHKGDWGKEPMILIFGKNPNDVLNKISCVL